MADRFIILVSDNSDLIVTPAQVPKTITYASQTPFEGTLPSFDPAPLVSVMGASHQRHFDVDTVGKTTCRIIASSSGGAPTNATLNLEIISLNAASASPSSGTAINFPYFCSLNDIDNELVNLTVAIASTGKLERTIKRLFISQSYGEIVSALGVGGYTVPVRNSVKQAISGAITASNNVVSFTVTDGTAYDIDETVRLHGQTASVFNSEFTPIVGISTNVLTVEFAKNSYNADSTCELCTLGFLHLRNCNTLGATYRALNALGIKDTSLSEKAEAMKKVYDKCLKELQDGVVVLDGLTRGSGLIKTYQTENPNADDVKNAPVFSLDMAS